MEGGGAHCWNNKYSQWFIVKGCRALHKFFYLGLKIDSNFNIISNSVPKWVCLKSYFTNQCLCSRSRPGKWKLRSRLKIFHSVGLRARPRYSIPGIFGGWNTEVFWYWWWKEVRNSEISKHWSIFPRGGGLPPLSLFKERGRRSL